MPVERAANALAIHCFLSAKTPDEFRLVIALKEDPIVAVAPRAEELLEQCTATRFEKPVGPKQRDVLRLLMAEHTNNEIATELHISEKTVKYHVSALLGKFEVKSRVALAKIGTDLTAGNGLFAEKKSPEEDVEKIMRAMFESKPNLARQSFRGGAVASR